MTAARADPGLLTLIALWISDEKTTLADLGYEGRTGDLQGLPFKKPKGGQLTEDQHAFYAVHGALRAASANARTPCSRPPTRSCDTTAAAPCD
jgi:hypothetical protein